MSYKLILQDFRNLQLQEVMQSEDRNALNEIKDRLEYFFAQAAVKLEVEIHEVEYPPCIQCGQPMPEGWGDVCPDCNSEKDIELLSCEECNELFEELRDDLCEKCHEYNYCECGRRLCEEEGSSPGDGLCRRCD